MILSLFSLLTACHSESGITEAGKISKPSLPESHQIAKKIVENLHDTEKLLTFVPSDSQVKSLLECKRENPLATSMTEFRQQLMNRPPEMQSLSTKIIRVEQTNEKTTAKGTADKNCRLVDDLTIRFMSVTALVEEDSRSKEKIIPVTLIKVQENWFFSPNPAKSMLDKAKKQEVKLQFKRLSKGISLYHSEYGELPNSLSLVGRYLRNEEVPQDPWGSDFGMRKSEECSWILTSNGADGEYQTFDDIGYCQPK